MVLDPIQDDEDEGSLLRGRVNRREQVDTLGRRENRKISGCLPDANASVFFPGSLNQLNPLR